MFFTFCGANWDKVECKVSIGEVCRGQNWAGSSASCLGLTTGSLCTAYEQDTEVQAQPSLTPDSQSLCLGGSGHCREGLLASWAELRGPETCLQVASSTGNHEKGCPSGQGPPGKTGVLPRRHRVQRFAWHPTVLLGHLPHAGPSAGLGEAREKNEPKVQGTSLP